MEEEGKPQKWQVVDRDRIVSIIKDVASAKVAEGSNQLYKRDVAEAIKDQKIKLEPDELEDILDDTLMENTHVSQEERRIKKVKVYDPSRLKENEEEHPDSRLTGMFDELSSRRFRK